MYKGKKQSTMHYNCAPELYHKSSNEIDLKYFNSNNGKIWFLYFLPSKFHACVSNVL